MKRRAIKGLSVILLLAITFPLKVEAWFTTDHPILASKADLCKPLPRPPKKRCVLPVDEILLKAEDTKRDLDSSSTIGC